MNRQDDSRTADAQKRVLDLKGLWWIPVVIVLAMLAMVVRIFLPLSEQGFGRNPNTRLETADYGFQLQGLQVQYEWISPSGVARDQIRSLTEPPTVAAADVPAINKQERRLYHRKFIVSGDRVIGVSINGEQRAYQINILNYHEIVNDTLGGVPIAVVYSPLCDSATVFRRYVGGQIREFGSSGLLLNSNILMYDRQPDIAGSSLWSQLLMEAVSGPAAGEELELVPSALTHWGDWSQRHPNTTLMARDTGESRDYNTNPYLRYYQLGRPRFPLARLPGEDGPELFDRVVALSNPDGGWQVYSFADIREAAGESGSVQHGNLQFSYIPHSRTLDPPGVVVTDLEGNYVVSVCSLWFAWFASHPGAVVSPFSAAAAD